MREVVLLVVSSDFWILLQLMSEFKEGRTACLGVGVLSPKARRGKPPGDRAGEASGLPDNRY